MVKRFLLALLVFMFLTVSAFAEVNINTADEKVLTTLHGIGQVKAAAIVKYRSEHGSFKSPDGLTKVNGIGDKTLEKLRDQIIVKESSP